MNNNFIKDLFNLLIFVFAFINCFGFPSSIILQFIRDWYKVKLILAMLKIGLIKKCFYKHEIKKRTHVEIQNNFQNRFHSLYIFRVGAYIDICSDDSLNVKYAWRGGEYFKFERRNGKNWFNTAVFCHPKWSPSQQWSLQWFLSI